MTQLEQWLYETAPTWLGRDGIVSVYEEGPSSGRQTIVVETLTGERPSWLPHTAGGCPVTVIQGGPYTP